MDNWDLGYYMYTSVCNIYELFSSYIFYSGYLTLLKNATSDVQAEGCGVFLLGDTAIMIEDQVLRAMGQNHRLRFGDLNQRMVSIESMLISIRKK